MQIFVQTRGAARASDYCFLGRAPDSSWWRNYREYTAFEHPTLLVYSDGVGWRAYLSGIPSARVDAVGTVVRYTLVLEGVCGTGADDDVRHALAVIAAWLSDVGAQAAGGSLQAALDREFPASVVERLITEGDEASWREAQQRATAALGALPAAGPAAATAPPSWIGDVASPASRAEFLGRAADLLDGSPGQALLLNLIGSREDGVTLAGNGFPVAILGEDVADVPRGQIAELHPKKEPPPPRHTSRVAVPPALPQPLPQPLPRTAPPGTLPATMPEPGPGTLPASVPGTAPGATRPNLLSRWWAALLDGLRRWFP